MQILKKPVAFLLALLMIISVPPMTVTADPTVHYAGDVMIMEDKIMILIVFLFK